MELTTRAYQPSDAPAVCELANLIDAHSGGHPGWLPDEVASFLDTSVRDSATDTRLVFTPDGGLAASALVPTPPDGGFRVDLLGGVHPDWRGRGLGRELFGWQLTRAAEIHRVNAPGMDWEIHADSMLDDETAHRLFRRFDLAPERYWFEMVALTATAPELPVPEGLRVADYAPEYEKSLYSVHMEAFEDHWGYQRRELADWVKVTIGMDTFRPELSALALDGDEVAGYVLSYDDADPQRLYIGQVGVRRPWRRRGVAGALLSRVLRAAGQAGKARAALGVDAASLTGAVGVYERAGFTVESRAVTHARPLPAVRV